MKRKSLLFSVLSVLCVGMAAGCGETKYAISVSPQSNEYGRVTGGGNYAKGATVNINVYPGMGCSPTNLIFTKNGETTGVEIPFTSEQDDHSVYQFAVSDDTIGSYVAYFECLQLSPAQDDERVRKYNVTYDLKVGGESKVVIDNPDGEGELPDNVEAVESGKKLTAINYIDGIDGKIAWYTQDVSTLEAADKAQYLYDFTKVVAGDFTLYGEVMDMSPEQIVQEAIDNFKNSSKLKITNGDETATIVDFNKEQKEYKITVSTTEGIKGILQKGIYYVYSGLNNKAGFALNSDKITDSFALSKLNDVYKFIELRDVVASDYTVELLEISDEERTVGSYKCKVYSLKDKVSTEEVMKVYVYNGVVYKVVKGTSNNVIEYGEAIATQVSDAKEMFFVRLYSDNETLNVTLSDVNGDFDTITKIVPSYGETLKDILDSETSPLFETLKRYDYSWYKYQGGECSNVEYPLNSIVSSNLDVCAKVNATIDPVEKALNYLENGNYDITTGIKIFDGELVTRLSSVEDGVNLFTSSKPSGMTSATWNTITSLGSLMREYYSFDYNSDTNEYSFYKSRTDLVNPYLIIKLNDDNMLIEKVTYFAGYTLDGDRNTYTSEFTYPYIKNVSDSINANVEYIKNNYYNKEVGFDFSTVADLDDHFYTFVSYVDEVSKVKLGNDIFDNSVYKFSVGNNNFIEREVWKVVDGKLYVSSAVLKSIMLNSAEGKLLVETIDSEDNTTYSVTLKFTLNSLNASPLTDVSGSSAGILDGFNYTSSNGTDSIRIKFGNDASLADVSVFTVNNKDGVKYFAYTKLSKIGEDYYLVLYPEYSNEGYSEDKSFTYEFNFVASNGDFGSYTFNITLTATGA